MKTIAVIPFSTSIAKDTLISLPYWDHIVGSYQKMGYDILLPDTLYKPDERKRDEKLAIVDAFHEALQNPDVCAIIATQGGRNSNRLLPFIDFSLIAAHPKPIFGFSDTTVLLNAIATCTGITCYHGPFLRDFGHHDNEIILTQLDTIINTGGKKIQPLNLQSTSSRWLPEYDFMAPLHKCAGRSSSASLNVSGALLGGNLTSLCALSGTKYFIPPNQPLILLLEDDGCESITSLARSLTHLAQQTRATNIVGLILGKSEAGSSRSDHDLLSLCLENFGETIPRLSGVECGHITPQSYFPIGSTITMTNDTIYR